MWLPLWWSYLHLDQYCGYMWPWRRLQVHVLQCSFGDSAQEFKKVPHPGFENNTIQDLKKYHPYTTWNTGSIENPKLLHIEISALVNSHKVREQCMLKATTELPGIYRDPSIPCTSRLLSLQRSWKKNKNNNKQVIKWKS